MLTHCRNNLCSINLRWVFVICENLSS